MLVKDQLITIMENTPFERKAYFSHYEHSFGKKMVAVFSHGATSETAKYNAVKDRYEFFSNDSIEK